MEVFHSPRTISDNDLGSSTEQIQDLNLDYVPEPEQPDMSLIEYEPYFDTITLPTPIPPITPIPPTTMATQTTTQTNMAGVQPTGPPITTPTALPPPPPVGN